jgi:hypothetical protein
MVFFSFLSGPLPLRPAEYQLEPFYGMAEPDVSLKCQEIVKVVVIVHIPGILPYPGVVTVSRHG